MIELLKGKKTFLLGAGMAALGIAAVVSPAVAAALPALGLAGVQPGALIIGGLVLIFGRDALNTAAQKIKQ